MACQPDPNADLARPAAAGASGRLRPVLALIVSLGLQACGGGGEGPSPASASTAAPAAAGATTPPTPSVAPAATPAPAPAPAPEPTPPPDSPGTDPAPLPEPVPTPTPVPAPDAPVSPDSGVRRILSANASMEIAGVPETPAAATAPTANTTRSFHIDSRLGNDSLDGRLAQADGNGQGPWRSLARLLRSGLGPGDEVILACGSQWRETLQLPADGTASRPITVRAAAGCATGTQPTIDGSITINPGAWQVHSGAIWATRIAEPVLALHGGTGSLHIAHHPNRGHDPAQPASPYAVLPADSPTLTVDGRNASIVLQLGSDLRLPPGTRLQDGARVRLRTNSWWMDESAVADHAGGTVRLATATRYPVRAGWGYYFYGQAWMLDSPGEWHHDPSSGRLLAWLPGPAAPTAAVHATVLPTGVALRGRRFVTVDGLTVRRVGTGVLADLSNGIVLRNLRVEDTAGVGVDASASEGLTVEASTLQGTGRDAIQGNTHLQRAAHGMTVRDTLIRDSAVRMEGEVADTLPITAYAAIGAGDRAQVSNNVLVNVGYIGIRVGSDSNVSGNFVQGSCSQFDDCAGIYTWASRDTIIRDNVVVRSRGTTVGKPTGERASAAQGIYLDESARRVLVERNTVIDADHGIQLHVSQDSTLRGNLLYGNRVSQIWLQETRNRDRPGGDLFGIVVEDNELAPVLPGSAALLLQTRFQSTQGFGRFERNHYYDRISPVVAVVDAAGRRQLLAAPQWRGSVGFGSTEPVDTAGSAASISPFATAVPTGSNLVPNADLRLGLAGWSHWNESAPRGQLQQQACAQGPCLRYVAGGSPGLVSTPNFSLRAGQWYRVAVDVAAEQDGQPVQMVLRRGGGGANGYEQLTTQSLVFTAQRAMRRHVFLVQATQTVNARDPATGDLGARLDIQGLVAGASVTMANPEVVAVQLTPQAFVSTVLVNAGAAPLAAPCPAALQQAGLCADTVTVAGQQTVAWPLTLPARGAALLFVQPRALADADGDGVPDSHDTCPATPSGEATSASGCAIAQR